MHAFDTIRPTSSMHRSSNTGDGPDAKPIPEEPAPVSIPVYPHTRDRLDSLKKSPDESYDAVISRLCDCRADDAPLSDEAMKEIEQSLAELREGISRTHEEIVRELVAKKEE